MLTLGLFVGLGALLGLRLRLPTFGLASIAVLVAYAVVEPAAVSTAERMLNLPLPAIALQIGYFIAILFRVLFTGTYRTGLDTRDIKR